MKNQYATASESIQGGHSGIDLAARFGVNNVFYSNRNR
jgi:hypothetical protein